MTSFLSFSFQPNSRHVLINDELGEYNVTVMSVVMTSVVVMSVVMSAVVMSDVLL